MQGFWFQWHRLRGWMLESRAARHYRAAGWHIRKSQERRNAGVRDTERAREHGDTADWIERARQANREQSR